MRYIISVLCCFIYQSARAVPITTRENAFCSSQVAFRSMYINKISIPLSSTDLFSFKTLLVVHITLRSGDFLDMKDSCNLSFAFALLDLVPFPELETSSKLLACSNKADMSHFCRLTQSVLRTLVVSKEWSDSTLVWF